MPRREATKFHPGLKIAWIEGRDLVRQAESWLPYEMVHTDWTVPLPQGSGCFPATSNGLASGNDRNEALVHAICELIERDGIALWHALGAEGQAGGGSSRTPWTTPTAAGCWNASTPPRSTSRFGT